MYFPWTETEKYAHVTFFFNGGIEKQFEGETRFMVPSPKVATYDLKPDMSAEEVGQEVTWKECYFLKTSILQSFLQVIPLLACSLWQLVLCLFYQMEVFMPRHVSFNKESYLTLLQLSIQVYH